MTPETGPLLEVKNLKKHFRINGGHVLKAVDDVSFNIYRGKTLGLVGESGCGKTTCGRTILRLYEPSSGGVRFNGQDVFSMKGRAEILRFKKEAQMIFQDPYSALDPRMTIGEIIAEGLEVHSGKNRRDRAEQVNSLLAQIGLVGDYAGRFPHELSGGQRQRVGIARALAVEPGFIVCDEPISALDVSIQAQIINLLIQLQENLGLTYLFISHDLSMVRHISDDVGVMYLGSLVETAESGELFKYPAHPYTRALISAIPTVASGPEAARRREKLSGEVPSPIDPPSGCKFRTRCPLAAAICAETAPALTQKSAGHFAACHKC
jgi:oligopeptide transport system ATP-binding protein